MLYTPMWEEGPEHDLLAAALGAENTAGFHLELYYQTSPFWDRPRRGDGTRFPCIDGANGYSGCLGPACAARTCWAGELVRSAVHAPRRRVSLPQLERRGATCHRCSKVTARDDGTVDCAEGKFDRPISVSALLRRRVPDSVPVPCPSFAQRPKPAAPRRIKRVKGTATCRPKGL